MGLEYCVHFCVCNSCIIQITNTLVNKMYKFDFKSVLVLF